MVYYAANYAIFFFKANLTLIFEVSEEETHFLAVQRAIRAQKNNKSIQTESIVASF